MEDSKAKKLEAVLEKASREYTQYHVKYTPFVQLADLGWILYLGSPDIGATRNQLWYDPEVKTYAIDFVHNLVEIVANQLSTIKTFGLQLYSINQQKSTSQQPISDEELATEREDRQRYTRLLFDSVSQLNQYLQENLDAFDQGLVNSNGFILGKSNTELKLRIQALRNLTFQLNHIPAGTQKYCEKIDEIIRFYERKINEEYAPGMIKPIKSLNQTPHPPSR